MKPIWYVYELVDPANGETFYIGKGKGSRMYNHGPDDANQFKADRIKAIGNDKVIRRKIAEFWDESAALVCEYERIKENPSLTNIQCLPAKLITPTFLEDFYHYVLEDTSPEFAEHICRKWWWIKLINKTWYEQTWNQLLDVVIEHYLISCETITDSNT